MESLRLVHVMAVPAARQDPDLLGLVERFVEARDERERYEGVVLAVDHGHGAPHAGSEERGVELLEWDAGGPLHAREHQARG